METGLTGIFGLNVTKRSKCGPNGEVELAKNLLMEDLGVKVKS